MGQVEDCVSFPMPVQKQFWNGECFVPMCVYRIKGMPTPGQIQWLTQNFGSSKIYQEGRFWEYSKSGNFFVMDEKVYAWFVLKWNQQ